MSIRMEDMGELAYGGVVTWADWWDNKRIEEGKLAATDTWKKAALWTYLGVGLPATLLSAFGWWPRYERWAEHISHGFLYDFPRFILGVVQSTKTSSHGSRSDAIKEAQRILNERRQLASGREAARNYQPEFKKAIAL